MSEFVGFLTNDALASTLVAAAIIGIITCLWRFGQNHKDSKAILNYLIKSSQETQHTFRGTEAIASETKLTEERVAELCAKNPKIRRNTKGKQSWRLAE